MIYTTIQDNLEMNLAEAKSYLKVDHCEEDDLIRDLILGTKAYIDNYLQNDFRNIFSEIVGVGDDIITGYSLAKTNIEIKSPILWKLEPGTIQKLPLYDPIKYGCRLYEDRDYSIDEATGDITLFTPLTRGYILYAESYRLTSEATIDIPEMIKVCAYQILAFFYNNRVSGQLECSIDGLGSCSYDIMPKSAKLILQKYKSYPGL